MEFLDVFYVIRFYKVGIFVTVVDALVRLHHVNEITVQLIFLKIVFRKSLGVFDDLLCLVIVVFGPHYLRFKI